MRKSRVRFRRSSVEATVRDQLFQEAIAAKAKLTDVERRRDEHRSAGGDEAGRVALDREWAAAKEEYACCVRRLNG